MESAVETKPAPLLEIRVVSPPGQEPGPTYEFHHTPITIGRSPENDVVINSNYVSEYHARIQVEANETRCIDLDSRNGSYTPTGEPLTPRTPHKLGEHNGLIVGTTLIELSRTGVTNDDPATRVFIRPRRPSTISAHPPHPNASLVDQLRVGALAREAINPAHADGDAPPVLSQPNVRPPTLHVRKIIRGLRARSRGELIIAAALIIVFRTALGYAFAQDSEPLALHDTAPSPTQAIEHQRDTDPHPTPRAAQPAQLEVATPPPPPPTTPPPPTLTPTSLKEIKTPSKKRTPNRSKQHTSKANLALGKAVYKKRCTVCHGDDGHGKTKLGTRFKIPSLKNSRKSRSAISRVVKNGVPNSKMRPYKSKLTREELTAVVAFTKKL